MNSVSRHALLAVDRVSSGHTDGGCFSLASTAFQEEERDNDKVANGLHAFVEQERRGYYGCVLAIRLEDLVREDKASHGLRLGSWAEELRQARGMSQRL